MCAYTMYVLVASAHRGQRQLISEAGAPGSCELSDVDAGR